jgi:hypothetical protein
VGRFENSIALAKASWAVLKENKRLTLLPLFSGITTIVVAVSFLVPVGLVSSTGGDNFQPGPVMWILTALWYLVSAFVVIFFNAALVYAADAHLHGVRVSVGDALRFAMSRAGVLLPWALVSATVSAVIRAIEDRGILGQIVGTIAGVAWSLVTFLVLPVLVVEGLGPIKAVKRSGELFKRAWGEQVIANAGISLLAFGAIVLGALPCIGLIAVGGPLLVVGIVALVTWVVAVAIVASALTGILQMALYRYATGSEVHGFSADQLNGAFRPRRRRS